MGERSMNTATVAASKSKYFRRGLLDGLTAPFKAFTPKRVTASFDNSILDNSYIGKSADMANIRSDFEKALHREWWSHKNEKDNS